MTSMTSRVLTRMLRPLQLPLLDMTGTLAGDAKWHQNLIIHFACVLKPKVYVELGIFKCGLFNQMAPLVGEAIGVDANAEAGGFMRKRRNASFVAATTYDFAAQLRKNPIEIDMLFIDADHSQRAVETDFLNFLPFVRPHGLIFLHDTHPINAAATAQERCGDGYLAIERLAKECCSFEMVTIPVHPGLTCCRKRVRQLSWQEEPGADGRARDRHLGGH